MEKRSKDRRGLWWTVRQVRHRFLPGALILCYHRVIDLPSDPHSLCVTPQIFAQHLELLRRHCRTMQLRELVRHLRQNTIPPRAVVLTFDDGYADNLYQVKPLLARYGLPATVFVTAGYLGSERERWSDELERLLLHPGTVPGRLSLHINGRLHAWALEEAVQYSEEDFQRHRFWTVELKHDPSPRQRLFRVLHKLLLPLPEVERGKILDQLSRWSGAQSVVRPTHRPLSPDEVVRLAEGDLVDIGAHSVTHPVLPKLPVAQQRDEIRQSKGDLEKFLGRPVTSFAYPYGARSPETVALVQEAKYECACINFDDVIFRGTDRFQLPRVCIGNWDVDIFARRLGIHA